jgi:hypothetical protein
VLTKTTSAPREKSNQNKNESLLKKYSTQETTIKIRDRNKPNHKLGFL